MPTGATGASWQTSLSLSLSLSLSNILCHSSFRPQKDHETSPVVRKCKNPRCGTCPHIEQRQKLVGIATKNEKFKIKEVIDSRKLIYCVCSGCGEKYIGKTGIYLEIE